ncbi:cupin domain-containing protein [Salinimonas lutimaris]|uniref:cupin domain-containing protein n=1 Tax=Salinimonas lutimaris TaxID=914153 RepID=UPI0010BFE7C4|nr:cupin domain-containing protein [Salinimonas lutimaris]
MFTLNLDTAAFLKSYWQQQPFVIRRGFDHFADFLDEHDLAGLSEMEEVDSRIISHKDNDWTMTAGPFDDFSEVCKDQWTLLVQAVDRYVDEAALLMDAFGFLPYWRMDDLMVSFATQGAGVGPHLDQYDVFLVQGKGRRHWKVGRPGEHQAVYPHPKLQQIAPFEPVLDVVLEPGDILYIPPGWPHDGVALEDCMTYSVGFRAPDQAQLSDTLTAVFEEQPTDSQRFTDPARAQAVRPALVEDADLQQLTRLLQNALEKPEWQTSLMRMLSDQHLPEMVPDTLATAASLQDALNNGQLVYRSPGTRPVYRQPAPHSSTFDFYVNGEMFTVAATMQDNCIRLIEGDVIDDSWLDTTGCAFFELLAILVNKGYWELEDISLE